MVPNYALQRTVDAPTRGALRRVHYFVPPRAVCACSAVAERGR
jgi:hypothetical protein